MDKFNLKELINKITVNEGHITAIYNPEDFCEKNPKEIFNLVCQTIADYYIPYGFKYLKSKHIIQFKNKDSGFIYEIHFDTSRYNGTANKHVGLIVHTAVRYPKFKKWLEEQKIDYRRKAYDDTISGGQIGNLQKKKDWMKWNMFNPETREERIKDVIENINRLAFPLFEVFEDIPALISTLESEGEHSYIGGSCGGYNHRGAIGIAEILLFFASKESVEKSFCSYLTKQNSWDRYFSTLAEYKKSGEEPDGTYLSQMAYLTKKLDLDLNPPLLRGAGGV